MEETRRLLRSKPYYGLPGYYYYDRETDINKSKSLGTEFETEWIHKRIEESNDPQIILDFHALENPSVGEYKESNRVDIERPIPQYYHAFDESRRFSNEMMTADFNRTSSTEPFSCVLRNIKNICVFICCIIPLSIVFIVLLIHVYKKSLI